MTKTIRQVDLLKTSPTLITDPVPPSADIILRQAIFSIAAVGGPQPEGDVGATAFQFIVTRTGNTAIAASVDWQVPAGIGFVADAADFIGGVLPSGTVSFAAGETSKTITVLVATDNLIETDETFSVQLTARDVNVAIAQGTATATILNDESYAELRIYAGGSTQPGSVVVHQEANTGQVAYQFDIRRSGDLNRVTTTNWQVAPSGATPASGNDFAGGVLPSGSVVFAAGETAKTITVQVAGDARVESQETFDVVISTPNNDATVMKTAATGVILNDDKASELYIFSGESGGFSHTIVKNEGNTGTTQYTFRIDRAAQTDRVTTVDWYVAQSPGSTVSLSDFFGGVLPSGTVTFGVGQTQKFITVNVAGDKTVEQNEAFDVILSNPSADSVVLGASATGVIVNDDQVSELYVHPADPAQGSQFVTLSEGDTGFTPFKFEIFRTGDVGRVTVANWQVTPSGPSAANGADFLGGSLPSGTVAFNVGETSKIITVQVKGDTRVESDKTFGFTVSTVSPDSVVMDGTATGVIYNDDRTSELYISSAESPGFSHTIVKSVNQR